LAAELAVAVAELLLVQVALGVLAEAEELEGM
jgi:hypothetical protein